MVLRRIAALIALSLMMYLAIAHTFYYFITVLVLGCVLAGVRRIRK